MRWLGKSGNHGPTSILLPIWPTFGRRMYLAIPQWSRVWFGSQIIDCSYRFCDDYSSIFASFTDVFFSIIYRTAMEQPGIFLYMSSMDLHWPDGDPSVLNCPQTDTEDDHPILCREVEAAVQSLKKGKSAGVDNIPAELAPAGWEDVITTLMTIWNKIWQTGDWLTPWTQSLVITLPKKGNLQQC